MWSDTCRRFYPLACVLVGVARRVARYVSAGADDAVLRHQDGPCEMQHPGADQIAG